mmetsp:Transcript_596/g.1372  ORF Transcript_596/g.1372 Transcript_596/m.1372 type:complete len:461 (+) Transcript_596:40-1422(+)|eukprot:CAMPEP_0185812600 /NCGR_PEP_ID=MMETSP1322-20130828/9428_1 /TAXON_ID=265543 /ORGANISM="Minutocellus polymorphus, Strain RCC2270" /LENGTH=460 /DNA_ID=CAMNT_0028509149 /DNA_START=37 /DNA_END=1416 /DNA_ORIENTATION=+
MARSDICSYALGTTFRAKRWLALDVSGLFCVCFSFAIHVFALYVISTRLVSDSRFALILFSSVYCPAAAMALISLCVAWTTDPGAVPMGARPVEVSLVDVEEGETEPSPGPGAASSPTRTTRGIRRCRKCGDNYKPPRAHHDSVTGRCIVKFDHFCPWVGNAVGALNHKFFFLFIFYTMMTSFLALVFLATRTIRCGYLVKSDDGEAENGSDDSEDGWTYKYSGCEELYTNICGALLVVAILFLIFTIMMMVEVVDAITSSRGKIARMKIRANRGDAEELAPVGRDQFNEMFGGDTGPNVAFHWFLPWIPVRFPGMQDAVLGYEYDPAWGDAPYREAEEASDAFESEPSSETGTAEREKKTTLRAGGAAVAVPPLVPHQPAESPRSPVSGVDLHVEEETDISSSSRHSVASTGTGSLSTGTRKRSTSKTRSQGDNIPNSDRNAGSGTRTLGTASSTPEIV